MAFEGQQRIVVRHPMTVVGHADHVFAALLDFDANGFRAGIERVFEQLLHHRRGPLDNFARRNFVRNGFGKYANAAHLAPGFPRSL